MIPKNNFSEKFQERIFVDVDEDYDFDSDNPILEEPEEQLQRTNLWRMIRNGCWTASMIKGLMSCNPKGGKMDWANPMKVFEFSPGALKTIYEVAKSRQRGYWIDSDAGKSAKYGTAVEPLIFEIARPYFKALGYDIERVGFVKLPELSTAGVSSDLLIYSPTEKLNGEIKACTSWGTHYDRCFDLMDEKGTDFWQVQMQMKAQQTAKSIYIVSEPPTNINKYVYAENIMDLLEDFRKECQLSYQEIHASPIHQKAMMQRIEIAENVVNRWLEDTSLNLKDILYNEIDLKRESTKEEVVFLTAKQQPEVVESKPEEITVQVGYDLPKGDLETSDLAKDLDVTFEMVSVEEVDFDFDTKEEPKEVIEKITDTTYLSKDFPF